MNKTLGVVVGEPPHALQHARLDNIALVPASLLPRREKYQTIANKLPQGGVLICETSSTPKLQAILANVARFFRAHGRQVTMLTWPLS